MQQVPFLLIISLGMTMSILTKGIDLSIGAVLALSSCIAAYFIKDGHIAAGVICGLLTGLALGFVNGILIAKVRLIPFIATYTMNMVIRGMAYLFMGGMLFHSFSPSFRSIAVGNAGPFSNLVIISLLILGILYFMLKRTIFGRNVYAIGMNEEAVRLTGVDTEKIIIIIYTINGLLAAITGLLYIARLNAAEATIANDFTIKMMAAVLIGGTPFIGGRGGVERTFIGILIMMFLANGMNLNGVSSLLQESVFGFAIIVSLYINKLGDKLALSR
jgi:ribose transport system permease protein